MICFLSCTKSKKSTRCKAVEMYSESDLFSKAYEYAKSLNPDHIYILSAKHHVLELDDVIEPYNLTLNDFSVEEREEWSNKVIDILKQKNVNFNQKAYFFAGESYTEFIKDHFKNRKEVFSGKGFGEILSFLDKKNESLTEHLKNKIVKSFMKSLNEYIYEVSLTEGSLTEGLLDRVKNKEVNHKAIIDEFLKENYDIQGSYTIKETKDGFIVDVKGNADVKNRNIVSLTNGLFEFGIVDGGFTCQGCKSLRTLEGAPKEVRGWFDCIECKSLRTLEGAPEKVSGTFYCDECKSLETLEGAPKEVGVNFYCSNCKSLKSIKNAPEKVWGGFCCNNCKSLTSLEGAPEEVGDFFDCSHCKSLTTLEGAPKEVAGNFECHHCDNLKSLKGAPKEVGWWFGCGECKSLRTLEGAPEKVGNSFDCRGCGIQFTEEDVRKYTNISRNIYV